MSSVERWLQTILCSQYAHVFEAYGYKSLHSVCSLQLPHLLAMGVPRNHCEKILDNLNNLRQTMFGHIPKPSDSDFYRYKYNPSLNPAVCALKTVAMNANYRGVNQYPDEYSGYGQSGNNMQPVGYHQGNYENSNMAMMNPMGGAGGGGYSLPGYDSSQSHMMMASQGQMQAHPTMYQQHSQQQAAYMAQQQQQQQQQQYYNSSGGSSGGGSSGGQYTGQAYSVQAGGSIPSAMGGSSPYYNAGSSQSQGSAGPRMVPPPHHHLRNTSGQQNPQQVADNILQMASSFPSHHTVQVPLKNRHAPYQIPRSPQNYYPDKGAGQQQSIGSQGPQQAMHTSQAMMGQQAVGSGQMQTKTSQPQGQIAQTSGLCQSPAMMYAGSSPHSQLQQNSPSSPLMMPSPAAAHQSQSLSSPGALHSPSSAAVCSPIPSSPGLGSMRSPSSMPMRSPVHISSGYSSQPVSSPPQRPLATSDSSGGAQHCSPTSMHSPASHSSSPYASAGMAHLVNSPPHSQSFSAPTHGSYNKINMLMDSGQGPGGQRVQGMHSHGSDPLQSLQKLVMLPETQVVDPKSVVSDGCLQNCEDGSKNFEGPAEQSREAVDCSAGVSVITSSPPTIDGLSAVHASPKETNAETMSAVQELGSESTGNNFAHDKEISPVTTASAISVNENVCVTPVSQSDVQTCISDTSDPTTQSTSPQIKSPCKSDALRDTVVSVLMNTETCRSEKEGSDTNEPEKSEPAVESIDQTDITSTCYSEKQSVSSPVLCNGPVTQELSNRVEEVQSSRENKTSSCKDEAESDNLKVLRELVPDIAKEPVEGIQDDNQEPVKNTCTIKTMLKPSPPKKRHSRRLMSSTGKSVVTSTTFSDGKCTAYNDLESQINADKIVLQPSESVKPSPPKKRHSRRISQSSSSLESSLADLCAVTIAAVIDNDNNASVKSGCQGSNAAGKAKLVNGFDRHGSQVESSDAVTEGKLLPKNHIQKKSSHKQPTDNCSKGQGKTPDVSLVPKGKAKDLMLTDHSALTKIVNGPEHRGPLTSSDKLDIGENDTESTVHLQGSSIMSDSSSKMPDVGIVNSNGNTNTMTDHSHISGDDSDSLSSEVDFGYDSPPCVDENEGNADCAENDSVEKTDQSAQECVKSSPPKATPFIATRSVTRSITGRAPKRRFEETYFTSYSSFGKRTRRSSYVTAQQNAMSLSMECDDVDMKESVSDVEVISSGDESHIVKQTDSKKNPSACIAIADTKCRKLPVVVLNKASSGNSKKDNKRSVKNQTSQIICPKSRKNVTNFYSVRGAGGRFISRRAAGISSKQITSQKIDCKNQFLIEVDEVNTSAQNVEYKYQSFDVADKQDTKDEVSDSYALNTVSVIKNENHRNTLAQHSVKPVTNVSPETAYPSNRTARSHTVMPIKPPQTPPHRRPSPSLNKTSGTCSNLSDKKGAQKKDEVRTLSKKKTKRRVKANKKQFEELDTVDDSFKNMKFSRTLHHLQNNRKDKSQSGGPFCPFVRVHGDHSAPSAVSVFNAPPISAKDHSKGKTKGASGSVAATTAIQATNFFSDKSVMLPWTKTNKGTWVCALCGKRSSYRFLGDLFGPYFLECHIPALKKLAAESSKKDSKHDAGSSELQNPHNTRRRSLCQVPTSSVEEVTNLLQEVWVHEDCAMWSNGVYVVGSRVYGLEEALKATDTMCACCHEEGALIGCLHKGCNQNFHYMCAVDQECFLDVENFSMLCPKHKMVQNVKVITEKYITSLWTDFSLNLDKRMKSSSASTNRS